MTKKTYFLTSLGCAKNSVDSDSIGQLLDRDGYRAVRSPEKAGVLIVNTCGFIGPAREESYQVLRSLASAKSPGQLLIAAGCLTQRYGEEVARQVPGLDGILGTRRWMDILQVVNGLRKSPHPQPIYHLPNDATIGQDEQATLRASRAGGGAFLKIADGCRRPCAFCAIPLIKGTTVSRPMEAILAEARQLRERGVRELILIAQDTTDYGHDIGLRDGLAILLENLTRSVPDMDWIRIMYAFPGYVTDRLIDMMATNRQILPYLDIPLQHAHPATLTRMRRPANIDWVHATIAKMRAALPGLAIRTTFIVGYPGETEAEFETLLDFVRSMRFDRVGAFEFSFEPGTASEALGDPVPAEVKRERYERLMELQQGISLQINQSFVGKELPVIVDGFDAEQNIALARSYRDAPEVDGWVLLEGSQPGDIRSLVQMGQIVPARVTGALAYDLNATLIKKRDG
jgi:ribosomal protein S12 methylthiotransferase